MLNEEALAQALETDADKIQIGQLIKDGAPHAARLDTPPKMFHFVVAFAKDVATLHAKKSTCPNLKIRWIVCGASFSLSGILNSDVER